MTHLSHVLCPLHLDGLDVGRAGNSSPCLQLRSLSPPLPSHPQGALEHGANPSLSLCLESSKHTLPFLQIINARGAGGFLGEWSHKSCTRAWSTGIHQDLLHHWPGQLRSGEKSTPRGCKSFFPGLFIIKVLQLLRIMEIPQQEAEICMNSTFVL